MNRRIVAEFAYRPLACFTIAFCVGIAAAWALFPPAWAMALGGLLCVAVALPFRPSGTLSPDFIGMKGILAAASGNERTGNRLPYH